jgi:hypothetical protein
MTKQHVLSSLDGLVDIAFTDTTIILQILNYITVPFVGHAKQKEKKHGKLF